MATLRFHYMTEDDFEALQGAERFGNGTMPQIATDDDEDVTVIVDRCGINVILVEGGTEYTYTTDFSRPLHNAETGRFIAQKILPKGKITGESLLQRGFFLAIEQEAY